MKQNYTHMILILDESGSMDSLQDATIEGVNSLVAKQKQDPGDFTTSLYKFNNCVSNHDTFTELNKMLYCPCGSTALFDAVCTAVDKEGQMLHRKPESERPDKVIVVIVTDGQENASKEFKIEDVKSRVKTQEEQYNWQFVFLGANIDAFATGSSYGITTRSTMQWTPTASGILSAYASVSESMTLYKSGVINCVDLSNVTQQANTNVTV